MKKILIFNDTTVIGGAEILLMELLKHLSTKSCDVTLLIPYPTEDKTLIDSVPSNVKIDYLYSKQPTALQRQLAINSMVLTPRIYAKFLGLNSITYDIVVCFKDSFYSIPFSRLKGRKFVWVHTQPYDRMISKKNLREFVSSVLNKTQMKRFYRSFRRYDKVLCVSPTCKSEFLRIAEHGEERPNVELMFNALNLSDIGEKAKEPIDLGEEKVPTFIVVHRFSPEKRIDRMVTIAERLLAEGYKLKMLILGKGQEFDAIASMINDRKLDDTVKLLGYLENPYPYIKASDWLVCCSSRDSFSLVLLEATALGTPIISTDCGGPVDVIDSGRYGLLTENSTESLYQGIKKVLDNPSLRDYYLTKKSESLSRFNYKEWLDKIDRMFDL